MLYRVNASAHLSLSLCLFDNSYQSLATYLLHLAPADFYLVLKVLSYPEELLIPDDRRKLCTTNENVFQNALKNWTKH